MLLAERVGAEPVRVFVDHPDGVDLAFCERVTSHLRDLLTEYSLEVSSPGPERPLSKPDHYRSVTSAAVLACARAGNTAAAGASRANWSARPTTRSRSPPTTGVVSIPYADIKRGNLLEG